jgi:hypothetical protein
MKEKIVPLLKISTSSSIYFDFEEEVPFIQNFVGSHTESEGKSYSYLKTILLSFVILLIAGAFGWLWDSFVRISVIFSVMVFTIIGIIVGKAVIRIMLLNSMGSRSYKKINKEDIRRVLKQRQGFIVLNITLWLFGVAVVVGSLISLIMDKINGEGSFMLALGWFVVIVLKSLHPQKGLKAIKILKKQMKEGNFDD